VFLRDPAQAWYQRGLPDIGGDVYAVRDFLAQKIDESGASEVRFVGNSMGGFAALLFGSLLRTGRVIAFVPQTFVSAGLRAQHGDHRWERQINELHGGGVGADFFEVAPVAAVHHPGLKADIYVANDPPLDGRHADQMLDFSDVRIHRFDVGGHALVKMLRDQGLLAGILR
jgi:pimeloyl-ACP methyl ester carboxylesterase